MLKTMHRFYSWLNHKDWLESKSVFIVKTYGRGKWKKENHVSSGVMRYQWTFFFFRRMNVYDESEQSLEINRKHCGRHQFGNHTNFTFN